MFWNLLIYFSGFIELDIFVTNIKPIMIHYETDMNQL